MSFRQIGGARIGWLNVTVPFAILYCEPDRLRLSCLGRLLEFERERIVALTRYKGLISPGLRIEHTIEDYPQLVVFWVSVLFASSEFASLKSRLHAIGYEVCD